MTTTDRDKTNRRIAEAMGYTWSTTEGLWRSGNRTYLGLPNYHLDANAALDAAKVIVPRWKLGPPDITSPHPRHWNWHASYDVLEQLPESASASTPALALTAMIEAVLDEREKQR